MTEFEFLRQMYRRLAEANSFVANASNKEQREAAENTVAMIKCSIQDYLNLRSKT